MFELHHRTNSDFDAIEKFNIFLFFFDCVLLAQGTHQTLCKMNTMNVLERIAAVNTQQEKKRLDWLDIAKGIAFICVIVGHTITSESPIRHLIFSFHMPLFFILAGYTFRSKPWRELLVSSFKRLVIPYLLIFCLWHIPSHLMASQPLSISSVYRMAMMLFFASGTTVQPFGFDAVGVSWFLMALFMTRLLMNGVARLLDGHDPHLWKQGVICFIALGVGVYIGDSLNLYLPLSLDISLVALLFMWCGRFARTVMNDKVLISWKCLTLSLVVWLAASQFSYLELAARQYAGLPAALVAALMGTLFVCCVAKHLEADKTPRLLVPVSSFARFCGKNGMLIYCIHCLDWWIPWMSLPALASFPFFHAVSSALRVAYCTLFAQLVKRV